MATSDAANQLNARKEEWRIAHLERLNLVEDPFRLSADPKYLYLGDEHRTAYRQAQGVIERRRGLGLITGQPGTGKTSLARRLLDIYFDDEDNIISYIPTAHFTTQFSAVRGFCDALATLNIPNKRNYDLQIAALQEAITEAYTDGKNIVLLLDDAQMMNRKALSVLHELYNFDFADKAIQVLAFGQEETVENFARYQAVNARLFVNLSSTLLAFPSAYQMVNYRVQTAGRNVPLFEDDAFTLIYEASRGGIPREIVRLCALATDQLMEDKGTVVTVETVQKILPIFLGGEREVEE